MRRNAALGERMKGIPDYSLASFRREVLVLWETPACRLPVGKAGTGRLFSAFSPLPTYCNLRSKRRISPFPFLLSYLFFASLLCTAQSSVLATGSWYKIGVTQSGIYKLTAADLQKMGVSTATLNPRTIRIYGNGGAMLPQRNASFRQTDLVENSIFLEGETDGTFDAADYVLFYGQGPHVVRYDSIAGQFTHQTNLYSDTTYYFLTVGTEPGKRIGNQPSLAGATQEVRSFDEYIFHEKDRFNVLASGREWWGEKFDALTTQTIPFELPGVVTGQPARITVSVMAQSTANSQFIVNAAGQSVGSVALLPITTGTYDLKGTVGTKSFNLAPAGSSLPVTLTFERSNGVGYLNWLSIQALRELKLYGEQTTFRSLESFKQAQLRYVIRGATADLRVWDISKILFPVNTEYRLQNSEISFEAAGQQWKEFVVFNPRATLLKPVSTQRMANQDLHGLVTPELLVVVPSIFLVEAQRLAELRRTHDGLRVAIVTTEQIYQEFSSGKQDITAIRDFIRHLYQQSTDLQYVLLFGDASYDYKNRLPDNTNFVPVYESYQSLHPIFSYSSDDYFGFMENSEGEWAETAAGDHTLEIAIGRLPVQTIAEARTAVDKLIRYAQNPETLGDWRQKVAFVADDGDANTHQLDADRLANSIETNHKTYAFQKLFLDAYPQVSYANGQKSPEAISAIDQAIDNGCLIMNYTGHGSELGWAQEQILGIEQINRWHNRNRMPLFVTATCEFGRYDDPERVSGAELAFLKANGGAIGLITTTRPVFSSSNYAVNVAFYNSVFEPINGQMPRLGDVMKYTKNNSLSGSINRNFALLGDPSMRLAYPSEQAVITKINNNPFASQQDTLKALSEIMLEGEIRNAAGNLLPTFNGTVQTTVLDKSSQATTLGTESARMNFRQQNSILFKGKTSVRNGQFRVTFVVPKDIGYSVAEGKISLYAQQSDEKRDAAGATTVLVGGSNPSPATDNQPPTIRLFMNDTTFVSGEQTDTNPVLLANLSDENGINTSSAGIGHELTATLDDSLSVVLNAYFTASTDTYQQGNVIYSFQNLTPGKHRLTLRAWDTYNNAADASLEFTVVAAPFRIWELSNYPNPVTKTTNFAFEHNRPGEDLTVQVHIYAANGQIISSLTQDIPFAPSRIDTMNWNLTSLGIHKLVAGIYFYRVVVRSIADSTTLAQKMIVIH